MGKSIHKFVGVELSFLKLGSVLVGLREVCWIILESPRIAKITVYEVNCVFRPVDCN